MPSEPPAPPASGGTLVFHQAALGDFVLTWPLLRRLPGPVTVVAPWGHARLAAEALPGVRGVGIEQFEFTRMHAEGGPTALSPAVRDLFVSAAAAVSFVAAPGDPWARNAERLLAHADRVLLDPRPPEGFTSHVTAWHAEAVGPVLPLSPPAEVAKASPPAGDAPVLLHPGSGGLMKCWPRDRFAGLAGRLREAGRAAAFLLGEAELERWRGAGLAELDAAGVPVHRLRDLDDLARAIRGCRAYVGNDAGPTHLAAQLGVPTLALFGPSDPARFRPLGPAVTVLVPPEPTAMHWLSVDDVEAALPI